MWQYQCDKKTCLRNLKLQTIIKKTCFIQDISLHLTSKFNHRITNWCSRIEVERFSIVDGIVYQQH